MLEEKEDIIVGIISRSIKKKKEEGRKKGRKKREEETRNACRKTHCRIIARGEKGGGGRWGEAEKEIS